MTLHDTDTELVEGGLGSEPRRPPTPGGVSMRPAMIVVGLAALILVLFVTIAIVSTQSPTPVKRSGGTVVVPGVTLRATSAAGLLSPIVAAGEPPANILNAVSLPIGSVRISHLNNAAGAGQFDSQVTFRSDDSQAALLAFYAADMKLQGWQVFDRGAGGEQPWRARGPGQTRRLGRVLLGDGGHHPADDVPLGRTRPRRDGLHRPAPPAGGPGLKPIGAARDARALVGRRLRPGRRPIRRVEGKHVGLGGRSVSR